MRHLLFFCFIILNTFLTPLAAQELKQVGQQQAFASVDISADEVAIGTPVKLTLTLLVPTMFRVQPEFPEYEAINVIVRTAGPDMRPVTKYINERKWTGASQTYWLYPMASGEFVFNGAQASGTYSDPIDSSTQDVVFNIKGFKFSAFIPEGAESLEPLIVADSLKLEQSWQGYHDDIKEGTAISRQVTASIDGAAALLLPQLIQEEKSDLVKVYAQSHKLVETNPLEGTGGKRSEKVTYVARYGGELVLPDIELRWFNTNTGEIETSSVKGQTVRIDAPFKPWLSKKQLLILAAIAFCIFSIAWFYMRFIHPALTRGLLKLYLRWRSSEPHAAHRVLLAIRKRELDTLLVCTEQWLEFHQSGDKIVQQRFIHALFAVGRQEFGNGPVADWHKLERTFKSARKELNAQRRKLKNKSLPELNPF